MRISKIHQKYAELLSNPQVLELPENFLGPNYKTVLNFWLWLESLSIEELEGFHSPFNTGVGETPTRIRIRQAAINAGHSNETSRAADAAWSVLHQRIEWLAAYATWEIIGSDKLIEMGHPFTYLKQFEVFCANPQTVHQSTH